MKNIWFILVMLLFISCADSESTDKTTSTIDEDNSEDVSSVVLYSPKGHAEDGPGSEGGTVSIRLHHDEDLMQTEEVYTTQTENNFGYYDSSRVMRATAHKYATITVTTFYFDETKNTMMPTQKPLKALADLSVNSVVNINPLTTVIIPRQIELFNDFESIYYQDLEAATTQAEKELMENVLNIYGVTDHFSDMALDKRNGSVLLAANVILLQDNDVAEQIALMNRIATELRDNGTVISQDIIDEISTNSQNVDLSGVKSNLENKYSLLGRVMSAPDFYNYIDSDGDGILNRDDADQSLNIDIIEGNLKITYGLNLNEHPAVKSGIDYWSEFAHPSIFDENTNAGYVCFNTSGQHLSIYNNNPNAQIWDNGYKVFRTGDAPGTVLKTIDHIDGSPFNGVEIEDLEGNSYSNLPCQFLGKLDFNFIAGDKIWYVLHNGGDIYIPTYGDNGVPFNEFGGRCLSNNGTDWQCFNGVGLDEIRIAFIEKF